MKKEFISYTQALTLKELGFDEPCFGYYQKSAVIGDNTILPIQIRNKASNFNDNEYSKMGVPFCSAPLYQQAFRWFREKYGLYSIVDIDSPPITFYYVITKKTQGGIGVQNEKFNFNTYEEAELACLKKLIEIVKQK
jgi:hypothetical protein